jgi:hypothetical protein
MGKRKEVEPQVTTWLFSCPATMTTRHIAEVLQVSDQPITEFSAQHWQETWQVGNDILRAYGYPENYLYHSGQKVGWDAISDWMFVKCWREEKEQFKGNVHKAMSVFVGELIIIRDSRKEVSINLAHFVDSVQAYIQHVQSMYALATGKLIVVLAGWTQPVLAERIAGHRIAWVLNSLS